MTDEQIIKALKMWLKEGDRNGECPLLEMGYCFDCACVPTEIASGILDLIKRQKTEIEKLKRENEILTINADTAFQDGLNEAQDLYAEQVKTEIKSEAIKEFAERLKEYSRELQITTDTSLLIVGVGRIDNLVKEMTEGEE